LSEGSQAYTDQLNAIAQRELALSDFIGRRSVRMSDISLVSSPTGTIDNSSFKAIDIDASTTSSDQDTFAVLEVDLGEVLTSTHEASTCPICQAMAAAKSGQSTLAAFDNLGVTAPQSDAAPATNTANVTGATTKGASGTSYIEAIRKGLIWDLSAGETLSYSYYSGGVSYDAAAYAALTYNAPLGASAISGANQTYLIKLLLLGTKRRNSHLRKSPKPELQWVNLEVLIQLEPTQVLAVPPTPITRTAVSSAATFGTLMTNQRI